jgi:hypothetical protein
VSTGEVFVYGSLAPTPGPSYFDAAGRAIDLNSKSRISLFQFCDVNGELSQRKVIFDQRGKPVGYVLLQFDRDQATQEHPKVLFCAFPKNRSVTQYIDDVRIPERLKQPMQKTANFGALSAIPRIGAAEEAQKTNGVYDLAQMRQIAYKTAKKGKLVAGKPIGDIGLAFKIVKPVCQTKKS